MMRNVQLSIVIPALNERERLTQSLETLSAHLSRSGHRDAEVIVVDDGSKDDPPTKVDGKPD